MCSGTLPRRPTFLPTLRLARSYSIMAALRGAWRLRLSFRTAVRIGFNRANRLTHAVVFDIVVDGDELDARQCERRSIDARCGRRAHGRRHSR